MTRLPGLCPRGRWSPLLVSAVLLTLVFGGPVETSGASGPGSNELYLPSDVATDAAGNVYVVDSGNNRIQKFTSDGAFIAKWGGKGSGNGRFSSPSGIATDPLGNVYVADPSSHRIQKFTADGTFVDKWGSHGSGDGQFRYPGDVATDAAGNVYVADGGNDRIQKFTSDGAFVTKWATDGSGNGESYGLAALATDAAGNVYAGEAGPMNIGYEQLGNRVQKFTSDGAFITKWGGVGSANGQFNSATGIATDAAGNVYVADELNDRIQKFTSDGVFIAKWGSRGSGDGQFYHPVGIATDPAGNVYVVEASVGPLSNDRIQKFTSDGVFIAKWGHRPSKPAVHKRKRLTIPTTRRQAFFHPSCGLSTRCRARVTVTSGSRTLARGSYSIPAHSSPQVAIALTAAGRATLARKDRVKATLTIVDPGTHKRESLPVVLTR